MKQKTRFKNFGNIGYWYWLSAHEWLIYQYHPPKKLYWLISTIKSA